MHIAVALLRISEGLDCSTVVGDAEEQKKNAQTIPGNQSFSQLSQGLKKYLKIMFSRTLNFYYNSCRTS